MNTCPTCGAAYDDPVRICPKDGTVLEGPAQARDSRLGETLDGKYRLDDRLGQGGMGAIYRATHLMLDKQVAVKLIKPELVGSPDLVRRFQREARAAGNLNHPNIAAAYDLGQTADGTLYIAMELVKGRSLKDVIRETGPLPVDRIVRILRQVGSALALAHRHNIIHRDLKPHNVMLADEGPREVAKLLDFGIAKTFDEASTQLTATGYVLGTPQYMSPEQAAGRTIDGRSDLYSLGIILYEMLTGEVPFNDPSTPALLVKHLTETPARPSVRRPDVTIPQVLETIALRLLAKDPADRFQTADELLAALPAETGTATAAVAPPGMDRTVVLPPPVPGGTRTPAPAGDATVVTPPPAAAPDATRPPTVAAPAPAATSPSPEATPPPAPVPAGATRPGQSAGAPMTPARAGAPMTPPAPAAAPAAASAAGSVHTEAAARGASTSSRPLKDMLLLVGLMALIVVGGAFAGMRLGLFGDGSGEETMADQDTTAAAPATDASDPLADTAMSGTGGAGDVPDGATGSADGSGATAASNSAAGPAAPAGTASAGNAGSTSSTAAAGAGSAGAAGRASSAGPTGPAGGTAVPAPAGPSAPAAAPAAGAVATQSASAGQAPAAAALPATPAVSFTCDGAPQVCGALRSAMTDAIGRHSLRPVTGAAGADVRVTADVILVDESAQELFGSTFVIRTYSIEFTGESSDGEMVSMPPPGTMTFDAAYAKQKLPEDARTMSMAVAGEVRGYWRARTAGN